VDFLKKKNELSINQKSFSQKNRQNLRPKNSTEQKDPIPEKCRQLKHLSKAL
jgi:hypothetical protein